VETLALNINCSPVIKVDMCPIYEAMTMYVQGGSNMTGTVTGLFTHK